MKSLTATSPILPLARLFGASALTLMLTACAGAPSPGTGPTGDGSQLVKLADDVDQRGDHATAAAMYERAIAQGDTGAEVRVKLGNARLASGDDAAAAEAFRDALREDIEQAPALLGLGTAQLRMGEPETALKSLTPAAPAVNSVAAWSRLGAAQALAGRSAPAVEAFTRASALDPKNLDVRTNLALAQALAGDADRASADVRQIVDSPLAEPRHYRNALLVLVLAGRESEAERLEIPDMSAAERAKLIDSARRIASLPTPAARAGALRLAAATSA
ncbi:tetratricopeptide repeat protein [Salinicola rhizosphaerae]|uniref:tetratricopeptide repeat protein n=1 Tax=Salinicola rhizosphaerae TaxID=1443141 RepID=UPI001676A2D3|nr:tetratricopeptide repeat protein [Salinicola rhizosphaerae]